MGAIRCVLAIIVLLSHAGFPAKTIGALASVQAFFVLSGIYMAAVYTTRYGLMPRGAILFYLNRFMRLWPTYLMLLALTALAYVALGQPDDGDDRIFDLFRALRNEGLTTSNATMLALSILFFGQDFVSVSEPHHLMLPVRQSWSIASELLFYLTVPLLFRIRSWQPLLVAFALLMVLKLTLLSIDWRLSYFLPFGNFGYFALGYGLYLLFNEPQIDEFREELSRYRPLLVAGVLVATIFFGESSFERGGVVRHLAYILIFSLGAILIFSRSMSLTDTFLGNISYGIYLNHFLILVVVHLLGLTGVPSVLMTLVGSVTLAILMEKVVQKPIDRYRYRLTGCAGAYKAG